MSVKTRDLGLTAYDELFQTDDSRAEFARDKVEDIDRSLIDSFPNHPFKVRMDNAMYEMADSVKQYGVLVPAIVRQKENGRYSSYYPPIFGSQDFYSVKKLFDIGSVDTR